MAWTSGTKLYGKRYTIDRQLGKGGFGITYLAKTRKGNPIVIKTLKDEVMDDPQYAEFRDNYQRQYRDEALRLAICRHPHIVQIDNVFHDDDRPCIAMEYVAGTDLERCVKGEKLSETKALRYIRQIGAALTVVHEKGLLHRDIKPHNIMVRASRDEAVLIDFGIAREFIPEVTLHHTIGMTPAFAPVEQYHEEAHRGEFTDVYALAATLYSLLAGKAPPPVTYRMAVGSFSIPEAWDNAIREAIAAGMEVNPADRPQTVAEWLDRLPKTQEPPVSPVSLQLKIFQFQTPKVDRRGKIVRRDSYQARYHTEDLGNGIGLDMVAIPGGTFLMGSPETEGGYHKSQSPQHRVTVPAFFMAKFPVTQAQWEAVMGNNPSYFKGKNRPVENVSWDDAMAFCQKLSQKLGKDYRLPSEAEWEYACRAGTTTPFYFGETLTTDLANYDGNYTYADGTKGEYRKQTTDVGQFPPNAFGLYDMHGNVWEWCADPWHENYHGAPTDGTIWSSSDESLNNVRLLRGGHWLNAPDRCRCASRRRYERDNRLSSIGFRLLSFPHRTS